MLYARWIPASLQTGLLMAKHEAASAPQGLHRALYGFALVTKVVCCLIFIEDVKR